MLVVLIILGLIPLTAFICGVLIGRTGREALRLELANLRGKHETLSESYKDVKRICSEALEVAKQRHFPKEPLRIDPSEGLERLSEGLKRFQQAIEHSAARSMPNYIPPEAKNCPQCSVSVRAESWPQECPACHCLFGFNEN